MSMSLSQLITLLQPLPPVQQEGGWRVVCTSQQRHALQALGTALAAKPSNDITEEQAAAVAQSITNLLQTITRPGLKLMEDVFHCDFYCTLLKTLNAAILEAKAWWPNNAGVIIDGLTRFMLYGLQPKGLPGPGPPPILSHTAPAPTNSSRAEPAGMGPSSAAQQRQSWQARRSDTGNGAGGGGGGGGAYCPPHRRRRNSHSSASDMSDSDASDTDTGQVSDKVRLSKVRLQMLTCLQSMAKTQPKALHPHWTSVLPVYQPLQPRPLSPHLITMLLFDPVSKVRSMAAATVSVMLEGPAQRGFLAVAEAKTVVRPAVRGFTTLSTSLGQLCLSVHTGLLHSIKHDINLASLTLAIRAVGSFIAAAPFERLPDSLLLEAVQGIHTRWQLLKHVAKGEDGAALHSAVLAALAAAFSTKAASMKLRQWLMESQAANAEQKPSSAGPQIDPPNSPNLLLEELITGAQCSNSVLRMEALTALKGIAGLYTDALEGRWPTLLHLAQFNLQQSSSSSPSTTTRGPSNPAVSTGNTSQDKAAHHAMKLIHTFLTAHSPARLDQEPPDADERLPSISSTTLHGSMSLPCSPTHMLPVAQVDGMWCSTVELLLGSALSHVSSMVRAAAFSACGDMPDSALRVVAGGGRERLEAAAARGVAQDTAPAVRSAACKLFGVVCEFKQCGEGERWERECWRVLGQALNDSTMSVKVAAAAAVANLASAYRRGFEEGVLRVPGDGGTVEAVQQLASLVVAAAQGAEKVRCHGVRALGQLLAFIEPEWLQQERGESKDVGVAVALECLQAGLASSSMKVQWNAAYAAASLLSNPALSTSPAVTPQLPGLLLLLLLLLRDSNNFKIRTHAALALSHADRATLDRVYPDVVTATLRALEGLQTRSGGDSDARPLVAPQDTVGTSTGGEAVNDANFPNYRYTSALLTQLKDLLIHLLSISQESDRPRLLEIISRRQGSFQAVAVELLQGSADGTADDDMVGGRDASGEVCASHGSAAGGDVIITGTRGDTGGGASGESSARNGTRAEGDVTITGTRGDAGGDASGDSSARNGTRAEGDFTFTGTRGDAGAGASGESSARNGTRAEGDVTITGTRRDTGGGAFGESSARNGTRAEEDVGITRINGYAGRSTGADDWHAPAVSERLLRAAAGMSMREHDTRQSNTLDPGPGYVHDTQHSTAGHGLLSKPSHTITPNQDALSAHDTQHSTAHHGHAWQPSHTITANQDALRVHDTQQSTAHHGHVSKPSHITSLIQDACISLKSREGASSCSAPPQLPTPSSSAIDHAGVIAGLTQLQDDASQRGCRESFKVAEGVGRRCISAMALPEMLEKCIQAARRCTLQTR